MFNLSPLSCTSINEYDSIAIVKRKGRNIRLAALRTRVLADYTAYDTRFSLIHNRAASTYLPTEKSDLLHCYNVSTAALEDLVKRIQDTQTVEMRHTCAYCLYNKIDETDHYIPKEEFAEFSVHAQNLVPICSKCNKAKLDVWRNLALNRRAFLHLYNDRLPTTQFLFANLTYVNSLPEFTWIINNVTGSITASLYAIIEDHFTRLNLADRYKKACGDLISEIDTTVKAQRILNPAVTSADIATILTAESRIEVAKYGPNYWKSIAKLILAADVQFMRSI